MCAQKNIRVLLNTHSYRVHLQRIELEPLCTPTRAHAFAVTLCTQETRKRTLTHYFWQPMLSVTIRCVYSSIAPGNNVGDDPRNMLDWQSRCEDAEKEIKNDDRHNFLFLPQPPREVRGVTRSGVGLTITQQTAPLASENKRLHRKKPRSAFALHFPQG